MVTTVEELPAIESMDTLFLDFETTSGEDKRKSINPHKYCEILGFNWSWDDHPDAYYVPMRHRESRYNLPVEECLYYLTTLLQHTRTRMVAHNLKYDVHVGMNSGRIDPEEFYRLELVDTRTIAKIIDSDRMEYSMEGLSRDWLFENIKIYNDSLKKYTHNKSGKAWKIHDYAIIPADVMAPYACQDIQTLRKLYNHCKAACPDECWDTWNAEVELTKELIRIERTGIRLDLPAVVKDTTQRVPQLLESIELKLHELTGQIFRPNVNEDCYNILCVQYGLPIMEYTKGSAKKAPEPSFGKDALDAYMGFKTDVPNFHRIVSLISRFRKWFKVHTAFLYPYLELCKNHGDGNIRLHTDFNQTVQTGRMAAARPNTQQVPPAARKYIIPEPDCVLLDFDLKQIEYRCIADLIDDQSIIDEYLSNPDADFHDTMAQRCGIDRPAAKTMNFGVSFGAGEPKTILMYRRAVNPDTVPAGITFEDYCDKRGKEIYKTYHKQVPKLKERKRLAERVARQRGFIRTKFGRRRYLTARFAYVAFNTAAQGWAADIMKRITLNLQKLFREEGVEELITIVAIVHDSWVINCPKNLTKEWIPKIKACIENTETRMRVPMYSSYDMSDQNWGKCK